MPDLGPRLKAARKDLGWSLRKAEQHSGVPNAHMERGRRVAPQSSARTARPRSVRR